jgi:AcrR family transcriptional regulator
MKKREKAKKETRKKLLNAAKQELIQKGLLNISTVDIAKSAGVAHGTLFFHFQNKENLIVEILDTELMNITTELNVLLHGPYDIESLLNRYLDFLEKEERFFAVIARETPFYPPKLRRTILGREAAIRSYFYRTLRNEIEQGKRKDVDITTVLIFLFGALNYYLSMRDSFTTGQSVISDKRHILVNTFIQLISN